MEYALQHIAGDWRRLIPSRFPPIDVYSRLGDSSLRSVAQELESLTNPRLRARNVVASAASEAGGVPARLQNWNHAPFAYKDPEGSTFLNPLFGVLELMDGVEAALRRAILRREVFLGRTDEPAMDLDMRVLVTRVEGEFVDLRDAPLDPDRSRRWQLGARLREDGAAGVLFRPSSHLADQGLAIFDAAALAAQSVQANHYRFVWDGRVISSVYDFSSGTEIRRDELFAQSAGQAAA